jgi:hypothetical protein
MSYHDRQSLNQTIPRHISKQELSPSLRNRIQDEYDHIYNHSLHITEEERYRWNQSAKRVLKPATAYADGLMTKEDKAKLDSIEPKANKYVHPFSNVVPGSYLEVTTDGLGHVIYGNNPARLNIRARNATKLGNINPDEFVSPDNAFLKGNVSFRKYPNDINHLNYPITKKDLVDQSLTTSYYISDDPTPNLNKIRISPTTNVASYYDADLNRWVDISLPNNIARLGPDGKVPLNLMPTQGLPIGAIIPSLSASMELMKEDGFLPLTGIEVEKNEYLDLYNFAKVSNILVPIYEYSKFERLPSIGFFFDKGNTFVLPKLNDFLCATNNISDTGRYTPSCTPRQTSTFNTMAKNDFLKDFDYNNRTAVNERLACYTGAFRIVERLAQATGSGVRRYSGNSILITKFNSNEGNDNESAINEPAHFNTIYMIKAKY